MASDLGSLVDSNGDVAIAGKPYKIRKLNVADRAETHNRIRQKRIQNYLALQLPIEEMDVRARDAHSDMISRLHGQMVTQNDLKTEVASEDGQVFWLWRCILKRPPQLTFDRVKETISNDELSEAIDVMGRLNGWDGDDEEGEKNPTAESTKSKGSHKSSSTTNKASKK